MDAAAPRPRLSVLGQTYVATVAALALITTIADAYVWFVALVVLSLPLSLLAVWVGLYAGLRSASSRAMTKRTTRGRWRWSGWSSGR